MGHAPNATNLSAESARLFVTLYVAVTFALAKWIVRRCPSQFHPGCRKRLPALKDWSLVLGKSYVSSKRCLRCIKCSSSPIDRSHRPRFRKPAILDARRPGGKAPQNGVLTDYKPQIRRLQNYVCRCGMQEGYPYEQTEPCRPVPDPHGRISFTPCPQCEDFGPTGVCFLAPMKCLTRIVFPVRCAFLVEIWSHHAACIISTSPHPTGPAIRMGGRASNAPVVRHRIRRSWRPPCRRSMPPGNPRDADTSRRL